MLRSSGVMIVLALAAVPAAGQEPATAIGRTLAQSLCVECHQVEANPTTQSRNPDAPRFADVARMPSTTALSIRVFLRSTHPTMPNFILGVEEIESLSAYILGLADKQKSEQAPADIDH